MNATRLFQTITAAGGLLICSCATPPSLRPALPPEAAFDQQPGTDQRIFLTLRLENGRELLFLADTGAEGTLLDKSLEPFLGKRLATAEVNWNGLGVLTNANLYAAPKLYLGHTRLLTGDRVVTDDLSRMSADRPVLGILGMDCLRHYCLQLDLAAHRLRFPDPDRPADQPAAGTRQFPLTLSWEDGKPRLRARLFGGENATYLLDTGCPDDADLQPDLYAREVRWLQTQHPGQTQYSKQMILSSGVVKHIICFPQITIDGEVCTNFILADSPAGNLLGLRFLSRHRATLNLPRQLLTLQPAADELFAGDPRATDRLFGQYTNSTALPEAAELIEKLRDQGKLPGWLNGTHGQFTINWTHDENSPDADSWFRIFVITQKNDPTQYHCIMVPAPGNGGWRLQRAWQTDAQGRLLKDWPVDGAAGGGHTP
jgi:hypothetical protein